LSTDDRTGVDETFPHTQTTKAAGPAGSVLGRPGPAPPWPSSALLSTARDRSRLFGKLASELGQGCPARTLILDLGLPRQFGERGTARDLILDVIDPTFRNAVAPCALCDTTRQRPIMQPGGAP
jgi:hypothetical protein